MSDTKQYCWFREELSDIKQTIAGTEQQKYYKYYLVVATTSSATTRQGEEDQSATQATILPARSFAAIFTALG